MPEFLHKHYIRINENSEVIYGFTDSFESPKPGDILLCQSGERHFGRDVFYPDLLPLNDSQMRPRWKWDGTKLIPNI